MKILISDLNTSKEALIRLGAMSFPISVALKIAIANEAIADALRAPEKLQKEIINKYAEPDKENPNMLQVPAEKVAAYQRDLFELFSSEVEVELPDLSLSELAETKEELAKIKITANDLLALKFLVKRNI
jgi:hypothetical protein